MADLHEEFRRIGEELTRSPRPAAADVRRRAERRHRAVMGAAVVVAAAVIGSTLAVRTALDDREVLAPVSRPESTSPTPSATSPSPAAMAPWLPAPWSLVSSGSRTTAPGTPSLVACGQSAQLTAAVAIAEQVLAHPSGRRARLVTYTPAAAEEVIQLFKFSYAACLVPGEVEGIGGPRNVWEYAAAAGASEPAGEALRVAEVTGASATRADAERVLDDWREEPP